MTTCVCCSQGCPVDGAVANEEDHFCQQCQKDGCPWPKIVPTEQVDSQERKVTE